MADDLETTDEVVETPPDEGSPDDDNDVSRLTRALEHEREERRQVKEELRRLREDDDYRRDFVSQFYDFTEDDDTDEPSEDEPSDLTEYEQRIVALERRNEDLEKRLGSREEQEFRKDFNSHLDQMAEPAGWELDDDDRLLLWSKSAAGNKGTPSFASTEKAFEEFIKREEKRLESRMQNYKKSKKTRHVSQSGRAATQVPDLDDRNARRAWMVDEVLKRQQAD